MWNLVGKWKRDINQMDVYNLLIEYLELEFNLRLYLDEHIYLCMNVNSGISVSIWHSARTWAWTV